MRQAPITFTFDSEPIQAQPGQSVGAALIAAGRRSWRRTRKDARPRGIFCGIGVCFDCLVIINGRPTRRACLAEARPGDEVRTQDGAGHDDIAC